MTSERYRITGDAHVYYVTYSVVQWLPVFVSEEPCRIVTDSLNFCREKKGLCTNAFVIIADPHARHFLRQGVQQRASAALPDGLSQVYR